jgi:hypothetical protein
VLRDGINCVDLPRERGEFVQFVRFIMPDLRMEAEDVL